MLSSKIVLNNEEFELLREYIQKVCGIVVGDEKVYLIESRLARLVVETGCSSFKEFYLKAKHDSSNKIRNKIIDAMTTNETLWFRDEKPWVILEEVILPKFIRDLKSGRREAIHVWSAAASTGQEPYSFAMLIHNAMEKNPFLKPSMFQILGTDISPSALYMAISGRYNNIAMSRGMRPGYRDKFFTKENNVFQIKDSIRKMVTFKQFNLLHDFLKIPTCDLVFARNVAIYFSPEIKRDLFRKIHGKIDEDGFFIIGSTESLIGYSRDFEQIEYKKGVYYRPKRS